MPLVKIETVRWMTVETKKKLFDAIHSALVCAFQIPDDDRIQRLVEYEPEDFESGSGRGKRFTIITISAFVGRSLEAKRKLYRELVTRIEPLGIPRNDLFILIEEHPMDNWGVRGGVPASDVAFGYKIKV
jgi:phenylpyruvate tautomerase PptA (4-oxalocrotonate tautomerase family)